MTTVRGSTILARTGPFARRRRVNVRPPIRLPAHPGRPDADRVRTLGACLLVKPLWIIDFGLRIGPGAGHGGRRFADLDGGEPGAVREVGRVDDGEHHQEGAEHRTAGEDLRFRGQLLRYRLPGVVAIAEYRRWHHHERHRE